MKADARLSVGIFASNVYLPDMKVYFTLVRDRFHIAFLHPLMRYPIFYVHVFHVILYEHI